MAMLLCVVVYLVRLVLLAPLRRRLRIPRGCGIRVTPTFVLSRGSIAKG